MPFTSPRAAARGTLPAAKLRPSGAQALLCANAGIVAQLLPGAQQTRRRRAAPDPYQCEWRGVRIAGSKPAQGAFSDRAGARATHGAANHYALIRALSIANGSSCALSRASCEKKFRLRRTIHLPTCAHRSRVRKIAAQECPDRIGRTT
jgi:hypothetical protein